MPYKRRASYARGPRPIVNSRTNRVYAEGSSGTTIVPTNIAIAVDNPVLATSTDVAFGCVIKAVWMSIDVCGLASTGVLQTHSFYLMKNPGNNLTPPNPRTEGSSNEKKFIFKTWNAMTMRNQDGNTPYHWEGWIRIPRKYQRMGADDVIELNTIATTGAGHISIMAIYKWRT